MAEVYWVIKSLFLHSGMGSAQSPLRMSANTTQQQQHMHRLAHGIPLVFDDGGETDNKTRLKDPESFN